MRLTELVMQLGDGGRPAGIPDTGPPPAAWVQRIGCNTPMGRILTEHAIFRQVGGRQAWDGV